MTGAAFQIQPGFATPFVQVRLPEPGSLNAELEELFLAREADGAVYRNAQPTMQIGRGLFESRFDLFAWPEPCVRRLREFCSAAVYKAVGELNGYGQDELAQLEMAADAWFHITRAGGAFGVHNHPMASWSGIYCVNPGYAADQDIESGTVQFLHPAPSSAMFVDLGVARLRSPWAVKPRDHRLRAGELVLFPSWLMHQVLPYTGAGTRITVAFNVWFRQKRDAESS